MDKTPDWLDVWREMETLPKAWIASKNLWGYNRVEVLLLPDRFKLGTGTLAVGRKAKGMWHLLDVRSGWRIDERWGLLELVTAWQGRELPSKVRDFVNNLPPSGYFAPAKIIKEKC
jgi:hypothetical protein